MGCAQVLTWLFDAQDGCSAIALENVSYVMRLCHKAHILDPCAVPQIWRYRGCCHGAYLRRLEEGD